MNPKQILIGLLSILIALAGDAREWIWWQIKPWPGVGKLLFAVALGVFMTFAWLHALDLLDEFLGIFNIKIQ